MKTNKAVSWHRSAALVTLLSAPLCAGCASIGIHHDTVATGDAFNATYRCDNGQDVTARYFPPDEARITVGRRAIDMHIARSADGARYVGGDLVWWTKGNGSGSTGTLFSHDAGAHQVTGEKITSCVQT